MRVLMLASYFPKPNNETMGNWALSQAQALRANGMDIRVISGTSWVPSCVAFTKGAQAYSQCPDTFEWGGLLAYYPRWLFYSSSILYQSLAANPAPQIRLAWLTIRRSLLKHVQDFKPDIIYAHHMQINGYIARQLNIITGLPYVITDHDFGELESCRQYARRREFFEDTVLNCSCMVAVSQRMQRIVNEVYPSATTATIHNGTVTPNLVDTTRTQPKHDSSIVIFCAAAFYERKGIPLLIQAFSLLNRKYPHSTLRIAGDGPLRSTIEQAIVDSNCSNRIELLGKLSHQSVLQNMASCDMFALPGWDEPFATVFSEAMSLGCPIVYAGDGGISDVVVHERNGLAVEPKSLESLTGALERLVHSPALREEMRVNNKALFERSLKWEHNAAHMQRVFHSTLFGVNADV